MERNLTKTDIDTICHAMRCMAEHVQYEDEWSESEIKKACERYAKVVKAVAPRAPVIGYIRMLGDQSYREHEEID